MLTWRFTNRNANSSQICSFTPFGIISSKTGQAHLTSESVVNLVVGRSCFLQVFVLRDDESQEDNRTAHLDLVLERQLYGRIQSMAVMKLSGRSRDSLLVAFPGAKLSVLEYDLATDDLVVVSLHCYERPDLPSGPRDGFGLPVVRVDPQGRAAAMLFGEKHMAVLPLASDFLSEEGDSADKRSYLVDLSAMELGYVEDFNFLHGYFQPTLVVLHQKHRTWAGRCSAIGAKDSCSVAAISLESNRRHTPIVWTCDGLPFDCHSVVPVSPPLGGTLVLSPNHVLYMNQTSRFGVSLNDFGDTHAALHLTKASIPPIVLDGCHSVFLSPNSLLVSLRTGDLYLFTIVHDNRTVHSIKPTRMSSAVLTSCMCTVEPSFLFLGSRFGDSLLIRVVEKVVGPSESSQDDQPPEKRLKLESTGSTDAGLFQDDWEEESLFATAPSTANSSKPESSVVEYKLIVEDHLSNMGPIRDLVVGESADPSSLSISDVCNSRTIEMVTCSGQGKNGCLHILQCGIRPEMISAFDLPGVLAIWSLRVKQERPNVSADDVTMGQEEATVHTPEAAEDRQSSDSSARHTHLVLSLQESTMVLASGEELQEISDRVGFEVNAPTLAAGSMMGHERAVQVCSRVVRLMNGVKLFQEVPSPSPAGIVFAQILDPHVVLLFADGSICLLTLQMPEGKLMEGPVLKDKISGENDIASAVCLFGDVPDSGKSTDMQVDSRRLFCAVVCASGILEIFSIPEFSRVYSCPEFSNGPCVLYNSLDLWESDKATLSCPPMHEVSFDLPLVLELKIMPLRNDSHSPLHILALLENGDCFVYRGFPYGHPSTQLLRWRFRRVEHGIITRELPSNPYPFHIHQQEAKAREVPKTLVPRFPTIRSFSDASSHCGAFICGPRPLWIFSDRNFVRAFPMTFDGPILGFASFNNINCSYGLVYCSSKGVLKICQLPPYMSLHNPWPTRKIALRCTPHKIAYHTESKTYIIGISYPVSLQSCDTPPPSHLIQAAERPPGTASNVPLPGPISAEKFELRVLTPGVWEITDRHVLGDGESVLALRVVNLYQEESMGLRSYVALGTSISVSEDVAVRGRIVIFDIINRTGSGPGAGRPALRDLCVKEHKSPISAVAQVDGNLLVAVGPKIILYNFSNGRELIGTSFYDAGFFVTSINTMKNWILMGDVCRSIEFLRWKAEGRTLTTLAREYQPLQVYATEFMVDQQNLGLLVTDADRNLQIFTYAPQSVESRGGQMLICKADIHLGAHVHKFVRLPIINVYPSQQSQRSSRHALFFGTLDGAVGFIRPVDERLYKLLGTLHAKMTYAIPHAAGLNPKDFRLFRTPTFMLRNHQKNVADGDLLYRFAFLQYDVQQWIARQIGSSPDAIFNCLLEIEQSVNFF